MCESAELDSNIAIMSLALYFSWSKRRRRDNISLSKRNSSDAYDDVALRLVPLVFIEY